MISNPIGKKFSFLVKDPLELLNQATRAGSAQWVAAPEAEEIELDHPDFSEPDGESGNGTSVAPAIGQGELEFDRIRVDMGSRKAVEAFNGVKNSGCIGGLG